MLGRNPKNIVWEWWGIGDPDASTSFGSGSVRLERVELLAYARYLFDCHLRISALLECFSNRQRHGSTNRIEIARRKGDRSDPSRILNGLAPVEHIQHLQRDSDTLRPLRTLCGGQSPEIGEHA